MLTLLFPIDTIYEFAERNAQLVGERCFPHLMADRQVGAAGTSKEGRKEGGTSSAAAAAITRLHRLADYSPAEEQRYSSSINLILKHPSYIARCNGIL